MKICLAVIILLAAGAAGFWLWRTAGVTASDEPLPTNLKSPRVVVKKEKRRLEVFDGDKLIKTYKVVLGWTPKGDKEIEGDGKTPLGEFRVVVRNQQSRFYLSLGLNYPRPQDAARGLRDKLISQEEYDEILLADKEQRLPPQKTKLGGEIYIHGGGTLTDWTAGCVALTNAEMKELFDALPAGTAVTIKP